MQKTNSIKVFCHIPDVSIHKAHEAAHQVRELVIKALDADVAPARVLPKSTRAIPVSLPVDLLDRVHEVAKQHDIPTPGRTVGGLLYALHQTMQTAPMKTADMGSDEKGLRSGQIKVLDELIPLLQEGRVVFSECGTGSGKGRMIARAAERVLELRDAGQMPGMPLLVEVPGEGGEAAGRYGSLVADMCRKAQEKLTERSGDLDFSVQKPCVLVVAPSIENVAHLVREWHASEAHVPSIALRKPAVLLGRSQFVCASAIANLLSEHEATEFPKIRQWFAQGMPAGLTEQTQLFAKVCPQARCLMADLEHLAMEEMFDYRACELTQDDLEDDQRPYQMLRLQMREGADIVFTTQALLALDTLMLTSKDRPSLLPPVCCLFIDEAHQMESVQASMIASSFSVFRLRYELNGDTWKKLRKQKASEDAIKRLNETAYLLKRFPNDTVFPVREFHGHEVFMDWTLLQGKASEMVAGLDALLKGLDKKSKTLAPSDLKSLSYVKGAKKALEGVLKGWNGMISQSPRRGMTSLTVGPASVSMQMAARWAATPAVALFSGTLSYVGTGGASCKFTAFELNVPEDRYAQTTPFHPQWLYSAPTLYQPSMTCFHRLMPPSQDDIGDDAMLGWLAACRDAIVMVADQAKGGMLILMTGYERLAKLATLLSEVEGIKPRLIEQTREMSTSRCKSIFVEAARDGIRPIWLATGPAGTGLDLSDALLPAEQDYLLTDLVIPSLPFGVTRGTTHIHRRQRHGFVVELMAAQKMLRQWIGRLVRRQGVLERRLWLLDGRLVNPVAAKNMEDLKRVLVNYLKRESFTIPT